LLPEYLQYWGFTTHPFSLAPDPDMLYFSSQHREGLLRLKYAIYSNKGGALLVSEHPGDGKTSLLLRLVADLREELGEKLSVAFLDHPTLTANQLIREITRQLTKGKAYRDKINNLNLLREHLQGLQREGYKSIAIIDEGQMLAQRPDIMQELRILLNLCDGDSFLLTLIFSGQKPLEGAIRSMPEFWQRLPVRFFLGNLNLTDTKGLIQYRLQRSGVQRDNIFTDTAYEGIYRFSQGCPRLICTLADLALLIGYTHYAKSIDFAQVSQACADLNKTGTGEHYYYYLRTKSRRRPSRLAGMAKETADQGSEDPDYALSRDFLLSLNRLLKDHHLRRTESYLKRYRFEGKDRPFFILPKGGLFRDSVIVEFSGPGGNFSSTKAGLAMANTAMYFILKRGMKKLPYSRVRTCQIQQLMLKGRPEYWLRIETDDSSCSLSFPGLKGLAKDFVHLLGSYIRNRCKL